MANSKVRSMEILDDFNASLMDISYVEPFLRIILKQHNTELEIEFTSKNFYQVLESKLDTIAHNKIEVQSIIQLVHVKLMELIMVDTIKESLLLIQQLNMEEFIVEKNNLPSNSKENQWRDNIINHGLTSLHRRGAEIKDYIKRKFREIENQEAYFNELYELDNLRRAAKDELIDNLNKKYIIESNRILDFARGIEDFVPNEEKEFELKIKQL